MTSTVNKWTFLESIVTKLCSDLTNFKVEKDKKITWESWTLRQIDTYIEWDIWGIKVKINIESKNYNTKIDIGEVDALIWKIQDTGIDIWVLVSVKWFTKWAKERAISWNIQLIEPLAVELNNHLLVPVWLIIPEIQRPPIFKFSWSSKHWWFRMPTDLSRVRIRVNKYHYDLAQLVYHIWNQNLIPRTAWNYDIPMNVMSIADKDNLDDFCYAELSINVNVIEKYYLKIIPVNGLKNITPWKEKNSYSMKIEIQSQDMSNWKECGSKDELISKVKENDKSNDIQNCIINTDYDIAI